MRRDFLPLTLTCLLFSCAAPGATPRSLEVRVTGVSDGDTLVVLDSNNLEHRVRLAGIDAPEKGQPFGERSRRALSDLVYGRIVTMEWSKKDSYGRFVAKITGGDPSRDVNLAQVSGGHAWHYRHFEDEQSKPDRVAYAAAEQLAREQRLGLWGEPDPVEPWDWRHGRAGGPVKKSRSSICHAPDMPGYSSVQKFTPFATLQECIASGGRPPRGSPAP